MLSKCNVSFAHDDERTNGGKGAVQNERKYLLLWVKNVVKSTFHFLTATATMLCSTVSCCFSSRLIHTSITSLTDYSLVNR